MLVGVIYLARLALKNLNSDHKESPQSSKNSPPNGVDQALEEWDRLKSDAQLKSKLTHRASSLSLFEFVEEIAATSLKKQPFERQSAELANRTLGNPDFETLVFQYGEFGEKRYATAAKQNGLTEESIEMLEAYRLWSAVQNCILTCAVSKYYASKDYRENLEKLARLDLKDLQGAKGSLSVRTDQEIASLIYERFEELTGGGSNLLFLLMPCRNVNGDANNLSIFFRRSEIYSRYILGKAQC